MQSSHSMHSPAQTRKPFSIPPSLASLMSHLPAWPGSVAFVSGMNLLLVPHLPADVAQALLHRGLRIGVRDAGVGFDFAWSGRAFAALPSTRQTPDLTITATAADFLALARREQDPDTLFFARRLVMEGDTELGLMVKNMLDALEVPVFDPRQWSSWKLPAPHVMVGSVWAAVQSLPHPPTRPQP